MPPLSPPVPRSQLAGVSRPNWTKAGLRDPAKLWLDKNENSDPALSQVVTAVMANLPPATYYTYPDSAALYAKLAAWVGCDPEYLCLAHGSDGVIRSVFEAFIAPGDTVLHTVPTFAMYPVYSAMYGARVVPLAYERGDHGPVLGVERVIGAIATERPRLVCLPNPDSPTGTVFDPDEMERIAAAAGAVGALLLVDEAYHPFYAWSAVSLVARHPHVVIGRSTGKAWGMAGLRIGYAVAAPAVAVALHKVRPMYETSTVAVAAFTAMLDHVDAMMASVGRLQEGKQAFLDAMDGLGFSTLRGHGNFLHVAFGDKAAAIHAGLADLVYYRADFAEPCLQGFSRFSSTTVDLFAPVIARTRQIAQT